MGYIYLMMGCIISSAVLPATLTLTWSGQNWLAAALSPPLGLACALIAWLVTAQRQCGALTVACTGSNYPMLAGNVTALLSPIIFIPVLTFAFGQQGYNWQSMAAINQGDDSDIAAKLGVDVEAIRSQGGVTAEALLDEAEQKHLRKSAIIARSMTVFMTVAFLVLWPMPLYGTGYVFSKGFFTGAFSIPFPCFPPKPQSYKYEPGWVVVGIMWLFFSAFCVGLFPLWQGRKTAAHTIKSMVLDLLGKKQAPLTALQGEHVAESATPQGEKDESESGGEEGKVLTTEVAEVKEKN
jgi:urea-proton symporter